MGNQIKQTFHFDKLQSTPIKVTVSIVGLFADFKPVQA